MTNEQLHEPPQRQLPQHQQTDEMIRRTLSDIIRDTVFDSALQGESVMVSKVCISSDLKSCTVHVLPMITPMITDSQLTKANLLAAVNHHNQRIRIQLCKKITLSYAPELIFVVDASFAEAS